MEDFEQDEFISKTQTAKQIDSIIKSAYSKTIQSKKRARFLVFGPGAENDDYRLLRRPVKTETESLGQWADFPEEIHDHKIKEYGTELGLSEAEITSILESWPAKELLLMQKYDFTIILLISEGPISEFSTFFAKVDVAHKIRLFVRKDVRKTNGYLNCGPIELFEKVHKQVYEFCEKSDLLEKIRKLVSDIMAYKFISDIF